MTDLNNLLVAIHDSEVQGLDIVIATVIKVEGSAYRRPGARMIISQSGASTGTVSGGCLERDVTRKAWWLTASGRPTVRRYSTGQDDDDLEDAELSFGLGCNGTVHIMFERIAKSRESLLLSVLRNVYSTGTPAAIATIIANDGYARASVGDRVTLDSRGIQHTPFLNPALVKQIEQDLDNVRVDRRTKHHKYSVDGTKNIEVLLEYLPAPRRLVIFGAGHDVIPLVAIAKLQGWRVYVVDARSHYARKERFPLAEAVICSSLDEPFSLSSLIEDSAVVIMSHSLSQDRHWLEGALSGAPFYVGQLGPKYRTERLLTEIDQKRITEKSLSTLHFPIGLDIGGDTPEAIALSIAGEINAAFSKRQGGMLKHRTSTIHSSEPAELSWSHDTHLHVS
ncbi:XdhC/CoxI family protein [Pseudomonas fluorescens]|uniref:XdhC/CoxI family protein n=1 Tax=Pseudomonas fluorescens TaxID=294 RepID=A0A327MXD0_PSEFL|nr:XdhC/CoxI family protein [Pseudomonas fluorescens]RAI64818.1 XdhC/CoxI family protein [Pseudomonas fluorescens]